MLAAALGMRRAHRIPANWPGDLDPL